MLRNQLLLLLYALRPASIMAALLIGKGEVPGCVVVSLTMRLLYQFFDLSPPVRGVLVILFTMLERGHNILAEVAI